MSNTTNVTWKKWQWGRRGFFCRLCWLHMCLYHHPISGFVFVVIWETQRWDEAAVEAERCVLLEGFPPRPTPLSSHSAYSAHTAPDGAWGRSVGPSLLHQDHWQLTLCQAFAWDLGSALSVDTLRRPQAQAHTVRSCMWRKWTLRGPLLSHGRGCNLLQFHQQTKEVATAHKESVCPETGR